MNKLHIAAAVNTADHHDEEPISNHMHADPTACRAIGSIEKELKRMRKEAERLRVLRRSNMLSSEEEERARRRFIGIYKPLLERALGY